MGLINPFIEQTVYVFDAMLGWPVERRSISLKPDFAPALDVCGLVELRGARRGALALGGSRRLAGRVAAKLLGPGRCHVEEDVADCIGELTNTVAGRATASLHQYRVRISVPSVLMGLPAAGRIDCRAPTVAVMFDSPDDEVWLEISIG